MAERQLADTDGNWRCWACGERQQHVIHLGIGQVFYCEACLFVAVHKGVLTLYNPDNAPDFSTVSNDYPPIASSTVEVNDEGVVSIDGLTIEFPA